MKNVPGAYPECWRYPEGMRFTTAQTTAASTLPASALPALALPVSALPRPLDFSFPSNRTAVYGAALFGAMALLLGRSWRQALGIGGSSLLAWATGRELDPDSPASAAVALGLAGISGLVQTRQKQTGQGQGAQERAAQAQTGQAQPGQTQAGQNPSRRNRGAAAPAILSGLAALSAVRLLTGTVGYAATRPDTLALSVQAGAAALAGYPVAAALPAAALALSAAEQDTLRPHTEWGAALALGAGLLPRVLGRRTSGAGSAGRQLPNKPPGTLLSALLSLVALSLSRTLTAAEQPLSRCDQVSLTVSASRLRASRIMGLGALAAGLLRGESASLVPLAAACLGTGLRRAVHGRSRPEQSGQAAA